MAIEIMPEPPVRITREEHDRYVREYHNFCKYHVAPPSFETYVRQREKEKQGRESS